MALWSEAWQAGKFRESRQGGELVDVDARKAASFSRTLADSEKMKSRLYCVI